MLQRVYTASGLLNLGSHQLAGLLHLRKPEHIRQDVRKRFHRSVQVAGCKGKAVGVDIVGVCCPGLCVKHRNVDAHDILLSHLQAHLLLRRHQRRVERGLVHARSGDDKILVGSQYPSLHLLAEGHVLPGKIQELPHQLITLILEELVPPPSCDKFLFRFCKLHAGRSDLCRCHMLSSLLSAHALCRFAEISVRRQACAAISTNLRTAYCFP